MHLEISSETIILEARKLCFGCERITIGCPVLNKLFKGGVASGNITELTGESSAGKTQLCFQLSLNCQLPLSHGGLEGSALYIYTEGRFPIQRLHELAVEMGSRDHDAGNKATSKFEENSRNFRTYSTAIEVLENIFIEEIYSIEDLLGYFQWRLPFQINQNLKRPIKLIVIDSVANLVRTDFESNLADLTYRAGLFFKLSSILRKFAMEYNLAVVVTNQAVDFMDDKSSNGFDELQVGNYEILSTSNRRVIPALGLSWSNCINSRFFLSKVDIPVTSVWDSSKLQLRKLQVVFSPELPRSEAHYIILKEGIRGVK